MKKFLTFILYLSFVFAAFSQQTAPKNIIVMIGDGMGFEHVNASIFFQGKTENNLWESFPVKLAAATYNESISYDSRLAWSDLEYVRSAYTESAAAATAIATGKKTALNHIGTNKNGHYLLNLVQLSKYHKKSAGVVTSVQFCHATPAGFVAHNQSRTKYQDIAFEMLIYSQADVIMGAGHPLYDNNGYNLQTPKFKYLSQELFEQLPSEKTEFIVQGKRYTVQDINFDNIPDEWAFGDSFTFLNKMKKSKKKPRRLFYLAPVYETLSQMREGPITYPFEVPINQNIPTLKNMTEVALEVLSQNKNGFFLMIEGGAIDWASHDNNLASLIEEMILFEQTVEFVIHWISEKKLWNETLLIVMADHECGYLTGSDNVSNYFVHVTDNGKGNLPNAHFLSNDHTNHLVPFFAKGQGSYLFKNYATLKDPIRGEYLHISNVFDAVKYFWGDAAVAYPANLLVCKGDQVTIRAMSSLDNPETYLWFVNGVVQEFQNNLEFTFVPENNMEIYCIISNGIQTIQTNVSKIRVENCQ